MSERCKCGMPLMYEIELDFGMCDDCLEASAERSRRRAEWGEYHPGEPCPDIELEP